MVEKAFEKHLSQSLTAAINVLKEMKEKESYLGQNLAGGCTINSLCVPVGVFLSKVINRLS